MRAWMARGREVRPSRTGERCGVSAGRVARISLPLVAGPIHADRWGQAHSCAGCDAPGRASGVRRDDADDATAREDGSMPQHSAPGHDIIVVGASTGGVEALAQLASGLPDDLPAAVFAV